MESLRLCRVYSLVLIYTVRGDFLTLYERWELILLFLDTGIQVSTDMARLVYAVVPGSSAVTNTEWSIPCNSTFPITLTFGDKSFVITERDSIVMLANGTCRGVVTGGAQDIAQVGAPFLRNVYTYVPYVVPFMTSCHIRYFFRQFGAQKASNGSVTFFVGFATKNLRQKSATASTTTAASTTTTSSARPTITTGSGALQMIVEPFSTLAMASIVAIISLW